MMEFTKEAISLCKQVAERGLSFEPPDDWHGAYHVFHQNKTFPWADGEDKPYYKSDEFVWIGTISDCLEFLGEKGYGKIFNFIYFIKDKWVFGAESYVVDTPYKKVRGEGKTRLEACLKAVLAVLGDSNG